MCGRVYIDIDIPLKNKMQVKVPKGDIITLTFKYEHLVTFFLWISKSFR